MDLQEKLAALGLTLPPVAKPVAAYVPAVTIGELVFVSGQLPFRDGTLLCTGKLPQVDPELAKQAAAQCFLNALAAASQAAAGRSLARVVRLGGFVACTPEFTAHPAVINGASELALAIFGEQGRHARAAVGVPSLPLDATVEVEAVFSLQ